MSFNIQIDVSGWGRNTCLPTDLDTSNLVDMTGVSDRFRVFLDTVTGVVHDGNKHHRQYQQQLAQENAR